MGFALLQVRSSPTRSQPLICVRDVEASSRWYQRLLGGATAHGGPDYERLTVGGQLVLQLHRWEVDTTTDGHDGRPDLHVTADSQPWIGFLRKERNVVWACCGGRFGSWARSNY